MRGGGGVIDISDHALVQYIERIKGVSLYKYRDEIRTLLSEHKKNPIPVGVYDDGILFILEPFRDPPIVVTVLESGDRPKRKIWHNRTFVHVPKPDEGRAA